MGLFAKTSNLRWSTIARLLAKVPPTVSPHERHVQVASDLANEANWEKKRLETMLAEAQGLRGAADSDVKNGTAGKKRDEDEDKFNFYDTLVEVLEGWSPTYLSTSLFPMWDLLVFRKIKKLDAPVDEGSWEDDFGEKFPCSLLLQKDGC
ncbi:hypothetical protein QBC41DRAFT_222772 [Cercophora samala]|uniref:Uncharacterized protein n=1 Tax=Cercophora samala TaxID=330535 RepID=A0AA39ZF98_9PEZI|nr:hypothetical protein QBC41DRAFT_222772 [Cercophora samala]